MRVVLPLLVLAAALVGALNFLGSGDAEGVQPTENALTPNTVLAEPSSLIDVAPKAESPAPEPAEAVIQEPVEALPVG